MESLKNALQFLNENWTTIIVIAGLALGLYKKIVTWLAMTDEEKLNIAKEQIKNIITKLVAEAQIQYKEDGAGAVKRSQVIAEIYKNYPILARVASQEEITKFIDDEINKALKTVREIDFEDK